MKRKEYLEKLEKAYQIILELYKDEIFDTLPYNYLLENALDNIDQVLNHNNYFMKGR